MNRLRLRNFWQRRGADIGAISAISIFFVLFFWRTIVGGDIIIGGDPLVYSYPLRMVAWEMIRNGILPLWTPLILSGYPLLSMAQLALGYPITWVYLFLPGQWAEQIIILVPYLLCPIFTYAYAREVGRSRLASLLAGLSFGYGGLMFSSIGMNGMLSNACMWLPLFLITIERARTRNFITSLLFATATFTMSVLTGIGQGFVYLGMLALAYAAFIAILPKKENPEDKANESDGWRGWRPLIVLTGMALVVQPKKWLEWGRWRPLVVTFGAIVLAAGVAAFQVMETLRAAKLSVRGELTYEQFSDGSFSLPMAFKGWLQPAYPFGDVTLYVPALATILALLALVISLGKSRRNPLILFWLIVAITAFMMILGSYTPLNYLFYQLPFVNRFRVPARHSFEWTFALSIIGAYGWDGLCSLITGRWKTVSAWREGFRLALGIISLAMSITIGGLWWLGFPTNRLHGTNISSASYHYPYLGWKVLFSLLIFVSVWQSLRLKSGRWRVGLLTSLVALACFVEPFIINTGFYPHFVVAPERFSTFTPTTNFLRKYPPEENRVYSHINPFNYPQNRNPPVDSTNITALGGLHHISGYEPLMPKRYSRGLNNQSWENIIYVPWLVPDYTLFEPKSHVLDLLNTTFVVADSNSDNGWKAKLEKKIVTLNKPKLGVDVTLDTPVKLISDGTEGDTLVFVTTLSNSTRIADQAIIARLSIYSSDGRVIERQLHADLMSIVHPALSPVSDSIPDTGEDKADSHRFISRVSLGTRLRIERVEITLAQSVASLILWEAYLYDSPMRRSIQLSIASDKWQVAYHDGGMIILRNLRALPRAWLVTDAKAVSDQEAWAAIRGQSDLTFDPRRTALLEIEPHKMPVLSGRPLSNDSYARIVGYKPNHLVIETKTDQPAVLVISEMHYPGWVAKIDGVKTSIINTDFLLRGIVTPPGLHRIEMRYHAPKARNGAIISLLTLLLICSLAIYAKRRSTRNLSAETPLLHETSHEEIFR